MAEAFFLELEDDAAFQPPEDSVIEDLLEKLQKEVYVGIVLDGRKTRVRDWRGKTWIIFVKELDDHAERVGYIEL